MLVTGVSRGIGHAILLRLLEESRIRIVKVIGISRTLLSDSPELQRLVQQFDCFLYVEMDLATEIDFQNIEQRAIQKWPECFACETSTEINQPKRFLFAIDVLIHNAAVAEPMQLIRNTSIEQWNKLFAVNLFSLVALTKWTLSLHKKWKDLSLQNHSNICPSKCRVIAVSSGAAVQSYPTWSAYCCSKSALNMFISTLAIEEAENVISISIRPGINIDLLFDFRKYDNVLIEMNECQMNLGSDLNLSKINLKSIFIISSSIPAIVSFLYFLVE